MAYDLHVVRTKSWLDAAYAPITKRDVDALIAGDPELDWSASSFIDMREEAGTVARSPLIEWRGTACFWWRINQIICSGPNDEQQRKLISMAETLNAHAVGDDGEIYEFRKGLLGRRRISISSP